MDIKIQFDINQHLFLKDPQETKLGKRIIEHGILLIHEVGLEAFTFKKLAEKIESTEASIYRYFENKHKFLAYLTSWYWEWVTFQINLKITDIDDAHEKLLAILEVLSRAGEENKDISFVNENVLHHIVVTEGVKVFHHKEVDEENEHGVYRNFKRLSKMIAELLKEVKPNIQHASSLSTILIETAFNHVYYAEHLPSLTDVKVSDADSVKELLEFLVK